VKANKSFNSRFVTNAVGPTVKTSNITDQMPAKMHIQMKHPMKHIIIHRQHNYIKIINIFLRILMMKLKHNQMDIMEMNIHWEKKSIIKKEIHLMMVKMEMQSQSRLYHLKKQLNKRKIKNILKLCLSYLPLKWIHSNMWQLESCKKQMVVMVQLILSVAQIMRKSLCLFLLNHHLILPLKPIERSLKRQPMSKRWREDIKTQRKR
jgi:hypothetical protein